MSSAYAEPVFIDGELKGCTLVFDVDFMDTRYRAGEPGRAAGSVTLLETDRSVVIGLKLGLTSNGRDAALEAPASAFLVSGTRTSAADLISSFESDLPGFRNFAFEPGEVTSAAVGDLMAGRAGSGSRALAGRSPSYSTSGWMTCRPTFSGSAPASSSTICKDPPADDLRRERR